MTSVAFDDDDDDTRDDEPDTEPGYFGPRPRLRLRPRRAGLVDGMTGTYGPLGATDPLLDAYDAEVARRKANRPDGETWWCDHCKAWVHTPLPHRYEGDTA